MHPIHTQKPGACCEVMQIGWLVRSSLLFSASSYFGPLRVKARKNMLSITERLRGNCLRRCLMSYFSPNFPDWIRCVFHSEIRLSSMEQVVLNCGNWSLIMASLKGNRRVKFPARK
ncbi:hypothetical protein TNIN_28121 [Trichonephila inaurata madagascariensis]|uniref:Uncharacterized protein n=1 Tax=Trichonephila inaurata madagascariensis TaxID=2747483 RepID=A0A8X6X1T6_9ARAC|nr:hypothetical protein TNIN_28121 [Trichonephila inaurata madagascariensis]